MSKAYVNADALGNEIVLGQKYGYSSKDGSWGRTTIGTAKKISASGQVALEVIEVKQFMYGFESDYRKDDHAKTVSVRPYMLFPVA